jgi:glycosyltransferase involved in cell wall biosynthesis
MRIAFYAPLKSPDDPVPSGDRLISRLIMQAMRTAGYEPWVASRLRTLDLDGDPVRQRSFARAGAKEVEGILAGLGTLSAGEWPAAWLTYHVYYKAPDWIGPAVARALDIPYLVVEGSRAPKRAEGAYAFAYQGAEAALDTAATVFYLKQRDFAALEAQRPSGQRLARLAPFLDLQTWPERHRSIRTGAPRLLTVAMMRFGNKLASYRALADALAYIDGRSWTLDIVGDGPGRMEVERAFADFGDRVRFHGQIDGSERLSEFYAAADLFLWPAVNEPFGMVFLESQAYGVPPVAGRSGGTPDAILHGETGILVEPGDARAFAAAVSDLLDAEDRRLALAERARRFVREERNLDRASVILEEGIREALWRAAKTVA